jgi:hypothetical protein
MDPALMGKKSIAGLLPCELMPYDWWNEKSDFCLNPALCTLDPVTKKDIKKNICFNMSKGNRVYVYVNEKVASSQTPKSKVSTPKVSTPKILQKNKCKTGQIVNPHTGRCIKINGPTAKKLGIIAAPQ